MESVTIFKCDYASQLPEYQLLSMVGKAVWKAVLTYKHKQTMQIMFRFK